MKIKLLGLFVALMVFTCIAGECNSGDVFRVRDGAVISFDRMIEELRKAKIVFVGEVHGHQAHHDLELRVVRSLHESGALLAVGLEMFRSESQKDLDAWISGSSSLEQFLVSYEDNWKQPWPSYRNIFIFARNHGIPLVGLNLPSDITRTVARGGFESLTAEQKKRLPPGIACDIDQTYMNFIKRAYAGHGHQQNKLFRNFCEAQMVWDKTMAWQLIEYLKKYPGETAIVLSGIGHAWKRGMPEQVTRQSTYTYKVVLPAIPGQIDLRSVSIHDADYVMLR